MTRVTRVAKMDSSVIEAVLAHIDPEMILHLEQGAVRIPSLTFEEHECARFFAREMERVGLDVELMEVVDPFGSGRTGLQPVGRLRGTGGGASMMFNGHLDHVPVVGQWDREPFSGDYENGYIYGRGAHDDKAGIVASVAAAAAIKAAKLSVRGDILVCPVMGHKSGGVGTRALIARGVIPTYCINTESTGMGVTRVAVGVIKFLIHARAKPIHFTQSAAARGQWMNPFEQLAAIMQRLGPSMQTIQPGGWLTFKPDPEVSDFPQLKYDDIVGGLVQGGASLEAQVRLVPGQSRATVKADVERVLVDLKRELPNLNCELEIPPKSGQYAGWDSPPFVVPIDSPIVQSLARWHAFVAGKQPEIGTGPRLGSVGDGNLLAGHGVVGVQYGPGSSRQYAQWPTPNERVLLEEIVIAAKAMALTTIELCA
jgi:acetylornithine deacetylase